VDLSKFLHEYHFRAFCFFRREVMANRSPSNFLDSCVLLLLALLQKTFDLRELNFYTKYREIRMVRYIEKTYNVKFVYGRNFAWDIFWRDYFQRSDFLPCCDDLIIDVGAGIGDFAVIAAKFYKAKRVIAIEPEPSTFRYLTKNIEINHLLGTIIPFMFAAYDSDGEILLYEREGRLASIPRGQVVKYQSKKLDSLVKELNLNKVNLVKIDTEGAELEILEGSECLLKHFRPKIIVEVHSKALREYVIRFLFFFNYYFVHEKINFHEPLISVLYFSPDTTKSKLGF